jgi:hypothetical protein
MNEVEISTFKAGFDEDVKAENSGEIRSLFTLSNSIRDVLVPVRATAFKASLRQRIENKSHEKTRFQIFAKRQNVIWMAVAAAGSLLSITGVVLIVVRKLKASTETDQPTAAAPI